MASSSVAGREGGGDPFDRLERHTERLISRQSFPGAVFATIAVGSFGFFFAGPPDYTRIARALLVLNLAALGWRFVVLRSIPPDSGPRAAFLRWRRLRSSSIYLMLALYGAQVALGLHSFGISAASFAMVLTLNAVTVGFAQVLAPMRRVAIQGVLLLNAPPIITVLGSEVSLRYAHAALMSLSVVYCIVLSRRLGRDYWRALFASDELREKTEALARVHEQTRRLIEKTPDPIGIVQDRRLLFVNAAWASAAGHAAADLVGKDVLELGPPEGHAALEALLASDPAVTADRAVDVPVRRGDGVLATWELRLGAAFEVEEGVMGRPLVGRDVTERDRLRSRLALSAHLASIGRLAAGVAHEINNPLTYVIANVDELRTTLAAATPPRPDLVGLLDETMEGADRVRTIVSDLSRISRDDGETVEEVALPDAVQFAARMAKKQVAQRARLVLDLPADLPKVLASRTRLAQVFTNLLVNAAQAIPEGAAEANRVVVRARVDGATVLVEVEDTGRGIPPDVRPRIFDPFFTTREVGEGAGIGLSIVHAAVQSFGGEISVRSEVGSGTTFCITLRAAPVAAVTTVSGRKAPPSHARDVALRPRVLVVDDEPAIGRAVARMLAREWAIEVEHDAERALQRMSEESFAAVVSDLTMPVHTGADLYRAMQTQDPALARRFVFITGGAFTEDLERFIERVEAPIVHKPIERESLVAAVRGVIERATASDETESPVVKGRRDSER